MGQRLIIKISDKNNKSIATCYYHWSGFTESALKLSQVVINGISNGIDPVEALKLTGAKNVGEKNRNRNDGLIDTEEKGMKESISWAEQLIDIKLTENKTIRYISINKLFNREAYIDDFEKFSNLADSKVEKIKITNWNYHSQVRELNKLFEQILELLKNEQYWFFLNEEFYRMIA